MPAKPDHQFPTYGTLVCRLLKVAEAEEELLRQLGAAVDCLDREEVFRIAAELTGRAASGSDLADRSNSSAK